MLQGSRRQRLRHRTLLHALSGPGVGDEATALTAVVKAMVVRGLHADACLRIYRWQIGAVFCPK